MGEVMALKINPAMKLWDGSVSEGVELTIKSSKAVEEAYIGCSIAVNGVCLTAIEYDHEKVRFFFFFLQLLPLQSYILPMHLPVIYSLQ